MAEPLQKVPEHYDIPPGWPLDVAMQQRAEALKVAREVMRKTQFMSATVGAETDDLIHMARYIITGKRNWRVADTRPEWDIPALTPLTTVKEQIPHD